MSAVLNSLDAWTTDQLLAEVLRRGAENDPAMQFMHGGKNNGGAPSAVLDERLIQSIRALAALMAVSLTSTRLPISAVSSEGDEAHEEAWQRFFL